MRIGDVVKALEDGKRAYREGWNRPDQYIELQVPDEHSKMGLPYIYICTVEGMFVPWLASQTDILANDWAIRDLPRTA